MASPAAAAAPKPASGAFSLRRDQLHIPRSHCLKCSFRSLQSYRNPRTHFHVKNGRCGVRSRDLRLILFSKRSVFQDFDSFVKPSRLLPSSEVNIFPNYVPEDALLSLKLGDSDSYYMLELRTSRAASSMMDMDAAILLSIIDSAGDAILQRIPSLSIIHRGSSEESESSQSLNFQRGSLDFVVFKGPKLRNIEALWIGLESGSWRLEKLQLTVIHGPLSFEDSSDEQLFNCVQYKFEERNICLGEMDQSIAELRPLISSELSGISVSALLNQQLTSSVLLPSFEELKADGLREYTDLKFSLLFYDAAVVLVVSTLLILLSNENASAYLLGGITGFLYLLLLQRSVDGLPIQQSGFAVDTEKESASLDSDGLDKLWLALPLVLAVAFAVLKIGMGASSIALTPQEIFFAAAGFLTNKLAVVLAAFLPRKRD